MSSFEAFILGLVQGLTEFLPVSSSGHLTIAKHLFGIETGDLGFDIAVHAATVLATIIVFRKEIMELLCGLFKFKYNDETKYVCMILVSMIPVFVVGMFFKDYVEGLFGSGLAIVGGALMVTALLLFLSESVKKAQTSGKGGGRMTYKSALWMGLAQAVAVIPGLSRSGSTIATGLLCGVDKKDVAKFSFLMVLVPILGEAFLDLVCGDAAGGAKNFVRLFSYHLDLVCGDAAGGATGGLQLAIGFASAFVSGLLACRFMLVIVRRAKLKWFAIYCAVVGLVCLLMNFCA